MAGIGLEVVEGLWMNAAIATTILFSTFLPAIFARGINAHIPPEFEVLTITFIFASLSLGETRDYYSKFWWWDVALHATSGGFLGDLGACWSMY